MQNIEFSVTCPYCGQTFRVASQPGAKVQCQCPNCHQQMVFDAPPAANAYQPQQPQQYAQPAPQQYNQPQQQYAQPMQQQYGQPMQQQYGQPMQQQYGQPMQQQYGQPAMQPQSAQPAPQSYGTQPGGQQKMDAQPSPYYQQAQDSPDSDYIDDDDDDEQPSFLEYYFWDLFFRHYADFRGKTPQRQYLLGTLVFSPLVTSLYFIILSLLFGNSVGRFLNEGTLNDGTVLCYALLGLGMLVMLIPGIAACVRRLHDTGKSGYYFFLAFIPFVGPLILFILCCAEGETESRHAKYGIPDWVFLCLILALLFRFLKSGATISM